MGRITPLSKGMSSPVTLTLAPRPKKTTGYSAEAALFSTMLWLVPGPKLTNSGWFNKDISADPDGTTSSLYLTSLVVFRGSGLLGVVYQATLFHVTDQGWQRYAAKSSAPAHHLSDWGIPIYEAASREALLATLADYIEVHESLRQKAGLLHRDISIGDLMVRSHGEQGQRRVFDRLRSRR